MSKRGEERIKEHWNFVIKTGYNPFQSYNTYAMKDVNRELAMFYKKFFAKETELHAIMDDFIQYNDIDPEQDDVYILESGILHKAISALMEYGERTVDGEDSFDRIAEIDVKNLVFNENDQLQKSSDRAYVKQKVQKHSSAMVSIRQLSYYLVLCYGRLGTFGRDGLEITDTSAYRNPKLYDGQFRPVFSHEICPGDVSPYDSDYDNLLAAFSNIARLYPYYVYRNVRDMCDGTVKFRLYNYADSEKDNPKAYFVDVNKEVGFTGLKESGGKAIWPRLYLEALKQANISSSIRPGELIPLCFGPDFSYSNYDDVLLKAKENKGNADDLYLQIENMIKRGALISVYLNEESEDYHDGAYYVTGTYCTGSEDDERIIRLYDVNVSNTKGLLMDAPLTDIYYQDFLDLVTCMDVNQHVHSDVYHAIKRKDYDLIDAEEIKEFQNKLLGKKECRSYVKCLFDILVMLLDTTSLIRDDSEEYNDFLFFAAESVWSIIMGLGSSRKITKDAICTLKQFSDKYQKTLKNCSTQWQIHRKKVCKTVDKLYEISQVDEKNDIRDPRIAFQKNYVLKLAQYICDKKGLESSAQTIQKIANQLLANTKFKRRMSKLSIITLANASEKQMSAIIS